MADPNNRERPDQGDDARRKEPRHPDDVYPDRSQRGAPAGAGTRRGGERPAPPDANPGREHQGSGVQNRHGRFGSSTKPEDLIDDEARSTDGGTDAPDERR